MPRRFFGIFALWLCTKFLQYIYCIAATFMFCHGKNLPGNGRVFLVKTGSKSKQVSCILEKTFQKECAFVPLFFVYSGIMDGFWDILPLLAQRAYIEHWLCLVQLCKRKVFKMKQKPKFYISEDRKSVVGLLCGDSQLSGFHELGETEREGVEEKHLPIVTSRDGTLEIVVGSVMHPMTSEHAIDWIWVQTNRGSHLVRLAGYSTPSVQVALLPDESPCCVFAYCNQHGLWKVKL